MKSQHKTKKLNPTGSVKGATFGLFSSYNKNLKHEISTQNKKIKPNGFYPEKRGCKPNRIGYIWLYICIIGVMTEKIIKPTIPPITMIITGAKSAVKVLISVFT